RMRRIGIDRFGDYYSLLKRNEKELERLINELSVKVSNFNWNPDLNDPNRLLDKKDMFQDTEKIDLIRKLLLKKGFKSSYKDNYFHRRIRIRMRKIGVIKYGDYYHVLINDDNELERLKKSLSINVTNFYRNPDTYEQFQYLFQWYVEEIVDSRRLPEIRIWSAGCAVGAEPYSIAMIVNQTLREKNNLNRYKIKIYATDFNEELLAIAREGIYENEVLGDMPKGVLSEYFTRIAPSQYKVIDEIRNMVDFSHLDLTSNIFPFGKLDIIFCRNVLIYFDNDLKDNLFRKFYEMINPGGLLVLGRTEAISLDFRDHYQSLSLKHRIYQKQVAGPQVQNTQKRPVIRYKCKTCGEVFHSSRDLDTHRKMHILKKRAFRCKICNKKLKSEIRLKVHMSIAHREITQKL
ncbi:MAG: CheR family methyltransferase, partial [Candidatus Hodarchaeales archaeon]